MCFPIHGNKKIFVESALNSLYVPNQNQRNETAFTNHFIIFIPNFVTQVECKELFYRDLPELNDSIADKILSRCSTIEEASC